VDVNQRLIKYVRTVPEREATGLVAQVYTQSRAGLGAVVEPLPVHSASPLLLAGAWMLLRETLAGRVECGLKEAVAATVSQSNRCAWCVDAHSIMLYATGCREVVQALDCGDMSHADGLEVRDPRAARLVAWAAATHSPGAPVLTAPPLHG
jgi:AhpD family alkylhydroperoxidase